MQGKVSKEDIEQEIKRIANVIPLKKQGMFKTLSANKWIEEASERPDPRQILGELWAEGEICILFADTGVGKSILAVQTADTVATGKAIKGLSTQIESQLALYLDFELTDKQFEARYSKDFTGHYRFSEKFLRAEIDSDRLDYDAQGFKDIEDYINYSLKQAIIQTGAKIIIFDNLTYLRNETEKARDALPLMKYLKALKKEFKLSILALAHTPKRDASKPITRNDLQGSKMLINFCDSAFALGESAKDKNIRYLKQIKARNTEVKYGSDNVIIFQIQKPENFLQFEFIGFGYEKEHLREPRVTDEAELNELMKQYRDKGKSYREIGSLLSISHMKVKRYLDNVKDALQQ